MADPGRPLGHDRKVKTSTMFVALAPATGVLPEDPARSCILKNRMIVDTRRALFAMRLSPDRRRLIFAGRAKFGDIDERGATPILHRFMTSVFPQLAEVRISHSWKGFVAFTFDHLPHIAEHDGVTISAAAREPAWR